MIEHYRILIGNLNTGGVYNFEQPFTDLFAWFG